MNKIPFEQETQNLKARKFLMWLFIVSSSMMFAALTSGYIVYTAESANRGIKIILPNAFMYSTGLILLSSLTMHLAYSSAKKLQFDKQKIYLVLTVLLGIAFFYAQVKSWSILFNMGVPFSFNPNASQSFIYVFTGMHLLHIFIGICMLLYTLLGKLNNIPQVRNLFRLEVSSLFWHFIDILWIYLYVFLLLNQ